MGMGSQSHAQVALSREREPLPLVQEAGLAPFPVKTEAKNLALKGIRSSDIPARSQSL
jgi:hypothetical protein